MQFSAEQIAGMLGGIVDGDPQVQVNQLAKIEEGVPGSLSFLANPKYEEFIYTTKASLIIVAESFQPASTLKATLIRVKDPYMAFTQLLHAYSQLQRDKKGVEQPSFVAASAKIGAEPYIGAFAYIGNGVVLGDRVKVYPQVYIGDNVKIGNDVTLFPGSKVYSDCVIGNHCTLHSGVVVGADGFGFAPNSDNNYQKVPQIGNVILEDHVEIGANTTVDRATLGSTIIRKGVKLDNLIQVAHNVEIGKNTVIAAQTGVAGSTKIGDDVMIGGQVGIVGHLSIANKVKIAAQSGVGQNVTKEGEILQGSPAFAVGDYKRSYVLFRKLPELNEKLSRIEKYIQELKQATS